MSFLPVTESYSPLPTLPNELLFEVASNLEKFKDLNSLLRTTRVYTPSSTPTFTAVP
jgi:hypothetical protein